MLGTDLAASGLRLRPDGGSRPGSLLVRAEQWRAASLRRAPVRPAQSGRLAERLAKLRAVTAQVTEDGLSGKDVRPLQRERIRLEEEIRELARHAPGSPVAPRVAPLDLRILTAEVLGDRALVEYVRLEDELHAVVSADGRFTRHRIGSYQAVLGELESLRFAMGRIAAQHGNSALLGAAQAIYTGTPGWSSTRMLLDPVRGADRREDRELVLVPTGSLHALGLVAALPTMEGQGAGRSRRSAQQLACGRAGAADGLARSEPRSAPAWPQASERRAAASSTRTPSRCTARTPAPRRWPGPGTARASRTSLRTAGSARTTRSSRTWNSRTVR